MEREGAGEFPLLLIGLLFECAEPVVDTILRQPLAPLRGKDIRTTLVTASVLEVVIQGTPGLVQEIDVAEFLPLVSHVQPANFRSDMGMLHQQMGHVTYA